jgi:hypothetical protein
MINSINGKQQYTTIGTRFEDQYLGSHNLNLTNRTTLPENHKYNTSRVGAGEKTDNISYNQNELMLSPNNGLKANPDKGNHKLFLQA